MICWFCEKYIVVVWYWFSCKWMSSISQHIFPILITHGKASIICAATNILSVWNNTSRLSASCFRQKYHYPAPGSSPIETCCLSSQLLGTSVSLDCDGSVMASFPRWLVRWGFTSASIYLLIKLHGNLSFEIPRDIQRCRRAEHTFDLSESISNKCMIVNRLFRFFTITMSRKTSFHNFGTLAICNSRFPKVRSPKSFGRYHYERHCREMQSLSWDTSVSSGERKLAAGFRTCGHFFEKMRLTLSISVIVL